VIEVARFIILHGPVATGVDFFTSDMDPKKTTVGADGQVTALLTAEGTWEGGHEMLIDKVSIKREILGGPQTWGGPAYSPYQRWEMTFDDYTYRLTQGADALAITEIRVPS
jgi:hypothetical protein